MSVSALRKTPDLKDASCVSMGAHSPCGDRVSCHGHAHPDAFAAAGATQHGPVPGLQHPTGATAGLRDGCGQRQGQGQCFGRAMPAVTVSCTSAQVLA